MPNTVKQTFSQLHCIIFFVFFVKPAHLNVVISTNEAAAEQRLAFLLQCTTWQHWQLWFEAAK